MPWSETCAMDERMRFVIAASEDETVMSEICVEFGISRQTGYKWLERYRCCWRWSTLMSIPDSKVSRAMPW